VIYQSDLSKGFIEVFIKNLFFVTYNIVKMLQEEPPKNIVLRILTRIVETTKWLFGYKNENLIDPTDYEVQKTENLNL
jgi:hypothetical protein